MGSQELGSSFEILTKDFFHSLFEEIGLQINNHWIQKSGMQGGFDVGFEIAVLNDSFFARSIFIECKNYAKSRLDQGQLHTKLIQFSQGGFKKENSIFIFLSPKADLKKSPQDCNPKHLEDFFSSTFKFKVIVLTPNSRIKDILSLNDSIYRAVYGEPALNNADALNRKDILDYFSRLFRSKGELPDFNVYAERKKYLEEAAGSKNKEFYIKRTLNSGVNLFLYEEENLLEALKAHDHILLLGEPGSGKTTEMIKAANYFKEQIAVLEITPIFKSLSNVTEFNIIDDILPSDWREHEKIVLFLDAWDEFEYRTKLAGELQIIKEKKTSEIKVVVSCRTYAYNDELSFLEPVKFQLNKFSISQSFELLSSKFNFSREILSSINVDRFKDILADPFMLNMLGSFYLKNNTFPKSVFELYNELKTGLDAQDSEMYTTCALILEMTREASLSFDELRSLFGLKSRKVQRLDLLEKSFDRKSIKFRHRNYQEFFAASALSALPIDQIKNFIVIPGTQRTHPSFFNTITFLLNILEEKKFNDIIEWIAANQPEFLFKTERSRTEKFRVSIFQDYFARQCVDKSLWIGNGNLASVKEIAEFGDCTENLEFLLEQIDKHRRETRVVNSALHLLSFFRIAEEKKQHIKKLFVSYFQEGNLSKSSKAGIIGCITAQKLSHGDDDYADEIFKILGSETDEEICRALLILITSHEIPDRWFWFIKEEFLRQNHIAKAPRGFLTSRGNSFNLEVLLLKLDSSDKFIDLLSYYFAKNSRMKINAALAKGLIQRAGEFGEQQKDFIIRLFMKIGDSLDFFRRDKVLGRMIAESGNILETAAYLIENNKFLAAGIYLAVAADKEVLDLVGDFFQKGMIRHEEVLSFSSMLMHYGSEKDLLSYFEEMMRKRGFVFPGSQNALKENQDQRKHEKQLFQKNFDVYFDKGMLLDEIKDIFSQNGYLEIDQGIIHDLENKWYDLNPYSEIPSSLHFVQEIVQDSNFPINLQHIEELLEDPYSRFCFICEKLGRNKGSDERFVVSQQQKEEIANWTQKAAAEIDFGQIITLVNERQFNTAKDYYRFETVMKLFELADVELPQEFLLNSIEYYQLDNFGEEFSFDYLKSKIADDALFDKRIIKDLNKKKFYSSVEERYVGYALENNLSEAMPKVGEYLLRKTTGLDIEAKLEKYYEITSNAELLVQCASDPDEFKCWSAMKILMRNNIRTEFCRDKALEFLNSDKQLGFYCFDALSILFQLNDPQAIIQYHRLLEKGEKNLSFHGSYSAVNYEVLEKLFFLVFGRNYKQNIYNYSIDFIKAYVSNLSREDQDFANTQAVLNGIKSSIDRERQDTEIFYINLLIDLSLSSHHNFKSLPLIFDEAVKKAEKFLV